MKADTHPAYEEIKVTCSCGSSFQTRSTVGKDLQIEVCAQCHPFYTGKQKMLDTGGRVDRFRKKYGMHRPSTVKQCRCAMFTMAIAWCCAMSEKFA
jgi:large subunit ribosomal protein L31